MSSVQNRMLKVGRNSDTCIVSVAKSLRGGIVQNKLTSNKRNTVDNFLKQPRLEKQIGKKFETHLKSLKKCYYARIFYSALNGEVPTIERFIVI